MDFKKQNVIRIEIQSTGSSLIEKAYKEIIFYNKNDFGNKSLHLECKTDIWRG